MRIGGLLKDSLIDWEGKIVSVIFTKGCNFRCGYCHNPSLVLPDLLNKTKDIPPEEVLSILKDRKGWIDGVVISGGEPTIHSDLPGFVSQVRGIGFKVKLDTNGTNPLMIRRLIDTKLIDYVSMDIKTSVKYEEYYIVTGCRIPEIIDTINESIAVLRMSGIQYQFRTTIIPGYHTDIILADLEKEFADDPYIRQPFREGITINSF